MPPDGFGGIFSANKKTPFGKPKGKMDCGDKDMNGAWMAASCHRGYRTMISNKCQLVFSPHKELL
ncbi:MAG: hypothetical protein PUI53_04400 [Butyricicoccus porcorum]|nr:hypothetical protein [Butyricicoccus porcorum]